jgi:hypothetical protein
MNRKRTSLLLALGAVLTLSTLAWHAPLLRTSQAAPAPSGDATFKGKVLLVHTSNMMTTPFLLEKVQVQKIGDRSFLVGKGAADGRLGDWYKGRTARLQLEHIVSIIEFDDLQDAKKALESGGGMPFGGPVPAVAVEAAGPVPALPAAPAPPQAVPPPPPAKR